MSDMAPMDPHDIVGWTIIAIGAIFTIFSFGAAFVWSVWPGERNPEHPKNLILSEDR